MRAAYALIAPTTCRGFSAAMAARSFAPDVSCAAFESFMPGSLRPRADLHHGTARDLSFQVRRKCRGQVRERDRARRDAIEMPRRAVAGDSRPHLEALFPARRRRVDAEQV